MDIKTGYPAVPAVGCARCRDPADRSQVADQIERVDEGAVDGPPPFRELINRLCGIPGVSVLSATAILAEIGRDPGLRRGRL